MGRTRRFCWIAPAMALLICAALAAQAAYGAAAGVTTAERKLALELQKRLVSKELWDQLQYRLPERRARELASELAGVYQRRAYRLDVDPAEDLAKELLRREYRLSEKDQVQYYAWALDALMHGAKLNEIKATLKNILDSSYGADRSYYLEALLGNASWYASPIPITEMAAIASNNGIVGRRLRDLIDWVISEVERGENPAPIKQMYEALAKMTPSVAIQRGVMDKCMNAVRQGAPAYRMANLVVTLSKTFQTPRLFEDALDRILQQYLAGTEFDKAVDSVLTPEKKPAER